MSDADKRFCERCGAKMGPYDPVCPECGSSVNGQSPIQAMVNDDIIEKASKTVALLLGIFALVSMIQGVIFMLVNDMTVDMIRALYTDVQWNEYLASMGLTSIDQYKKALFLEGAVMLVDGCAVAVSFLCYRYRKSFTVSIALCIYASFFLLSEFLLYKLDLLDTLFLIVECGIGLYVARMIYVTRSIFNNSE